MNTLSRQHFRWFRYCHLCRVFVYSPVWHCCLHCARLMCYDNWLPWTNIDCFNRQNIIMLSNPIIYWLYNVEMWQAFQNILGGIFLSFVWILTHPLGYVRDNLNQYLTRRWPGAHFNIFIIFKIRCNNGNYYCGKRGPLTCGEQWYITFMFPFHFQYFHEFHVPSRQHRHSPSSGNYKLLA